MEFNTKILGDIGIIELKGKLMGLPDTDVLNSEIKALIGKKIKKIILDLYQVEWINSSGIGAIMRGFVSMKKIEGQLSLARLSEKVVSVLDITQLTLIFRPFKSLDNAIESLRSGYDRI